MKHAALCLLFMLPCAWSLTITRTAAASADLKPQPPADPALKQKKAAESAALAHRLSAMMPMLYQEWASANMKQDFPLEFDTTNLVQANPPLQGQDAPKWGPFEVGRGQMAPVNPKPPQKPVAPWVPAYPAKKANATAFAPAKPSRWITPEIADAPKCQIPKNLTFCKGVDYPVPYYGWSEWEEYVDKSLQYNLESAFTETDEDLSDTYIFHPLTRGKEYQCATAMKAIGCSVYFPKCDPGNVDKVMKPCKHLCLTFVETLECPAFEGSIVDLYDCSTTKTNTTTPAYSSSGKCTDYSDDVVPDEPEAVGFGS